MNRDHSVAFEIASKYCISDWKWSNKMIRVNIGVLRISEIKWIGMGNFNSDDHYICVPYSSVVKEFSCQYKRHEFNPWVRKIPWSRKWKHTPIFLPGKFHGLKILEGYSSWGHKKSENTKHTHT